MASDQQNTSRKSFTFADAVHAVERTFSTATSRPRRSSEAEARRSPSYVLGGGEGSASGSASNDSFPQIDDVQLYALFPSLPQTQPGKGKEGQGEEARRCVRATLEEMELNWKLDPQTLGERSDYNRGCAALVGLLSRVHAQAEGSSAPSGGRAGRQEGSGRIDEGGEGSGGQGSNNQFGGGKAGKSVATPAARTYETHDLLRAIDRRDAETVLAIRDANFDLLLDLSPGGTSSSSSNVAAAGSAGGAANTPLGYCIGLGKGWEGIGIVLTGALSRFVNQLPDPEETEIDAPPLAPGNDKNRIAKRKAVKSELDPRTLARLRKVRVNLKLAIDHSLTAERTSLLASYMQVLVMSEGTSFIHNSTTAVQHALHARLSGSSAPSTISGPTSVGSGAILSSSDPFSVARSSVLQFVTDSLRHKSDRVAAVEDYVHNATGDLVLMGLWQSVCLQNYEIALLPSAEEEDGGDEGTRRTLEPIQELGQGLPPYFFARDDRVTSHFIERVQRLERALEVIQAKSVTAGASAGGGAKRTKRNPRMWKVAREVKERLQESVRRLNSGERLEVVRSTVMR